VTLPDIQRRLSAAEEAATREGIGGSDNGLTENDIAATLADWTGIPVAKMLEGEAEKLLKMEERLAQRVVGQDEPVRAIARAVRRGRVGLRDPGKPIGSFLFLGPSGVGKTELAKALAEFLFDDEQALTRLDMSEFMERHMAQRLIGAPPGYADSEQGGFLTEAARRGPTACCSSTRSRRRTPTSSTCCSKCSTTAASPTAAGAPRTSRTPS
jgi:ATP-dependent Clp protease ATP-binding subunit ClpB